MTPLAHAPYPPNTASLAVVRSFANRLPHPTRADERLRTWPRRHQYKLRSRVKSHAGYALCVADPSRRLAQPAAMECGITVIVSRRSICPPLFIPRSRFVCRNPVGRGQSQGSQGLLEGNAAKAPRAMEEREELVPPLEVGSRVAWRESVRTGMHCIKVRSIRGEVAHHRCEASEADHRPLCACPV